MTFGKMTPGEYPQRQYRPQPAQQQRAPRYDSYTTSMPERKVSFLLWIGILGLPVPFAFFTLAKGYSNRDRTISLVYVGLLITLSLIFGDHSPKSDPVTEQSQTSPSVASASVNPELAAAQLRLKRATALEAYTFLTVATPSMNESAEHFNARVTKLYNDWVQAEKDAEGENWQQAYLDRANEKWDCSDLYGPFSHEDAQLRQLRAACAMKAEADKYAAPPTIPTLDEFLMKPEPPVAPASDVQAIQPVADAPPVSEEPEQVVTIYQGQ